MTTPHRPRRRSRGLLAALALALMFGGCATRAPPRSPATDGPEARPPPDLMRIPDALPVLEPIRAGGPNKPYAVLGESYTPLPADAALSQSGLASWYGRPFHGRRTASGEVFNMYAMSAAHRTLPLPSFARVTNPANGSTVIVRVNDRGPFIKGRIIDLSYTAAVKLGVTGLAAVQVERITPEQIRNGSWLRDERRDPPRVIDGDEPPAPAVVLPLPLDAATPESSTAPTAAGRGYWVQLGAYRHRSGAEQVQRQAAEAIEGLGPLLAVFAERALHRVQAGPYAQRDDAQRTADLVRQALRLAPVVIERR